MMKTLIFYNNKGGVSKTMTCVNLACIFAEKGLKTLLIDLDPQANATHFFLKDKSVYSKTVKDLLDARIDIASIDDVIYPSPNVPNLWIIPAEADLDDAETSMMIDSLVGINKQPKFYLMQYLQQMQHPIDIVLIDTHPSKKRLLNLNGLVASDYVFIPVDSDPESFEGMNGLIETYHECLDLNPKTKIGGIIYTKFRNTAADAQALEILSEKLVDKNGKSLLLDTAIPLRTKAVESRWEKTPLIQYAPNDACSLSYRQLAEEVLTIINK